MGAEALANLPAAPPSDEERLESYFAEGIDLSEFPELFPLRQASEELSAFATLFRGTFAGVMVKVRMLRELCVATESSSWNIAELRTRFAYVDEGKLVSVLEKLRGHRDARSRRGICHL